MRFLVLDRYIARELVSPFAFGCMLFTFFPVIDRIYDLTDLVITKGVPFYLVDRSWLQTVGHDENASRKPSTNKIVAVGEQSTLT